MLSKFKHLILCISFIGFLIVGCGEEKINSPVKSTEYKFYFTGAGSKPLISYNASLNTIDSFPLPFTGGTGLTASADGSCLFRSTDVATLAIINAKTLNVTSELPFNAIGDVAVSPDGNYLALACDSLVILNTEDYSITYRDTNQLHNGIFSSDSRYYLALDYAFRVYCLDIKGGFTVQIIDVPDVSEINKLVPSADNQKWYILTDWSFEIYDLQLDSIIHEETDSLITGTGDLVISSDGKYVFYSPGMCPICSPPPSGFMVFDTEANQNSQFVSTKGIEDGTNPTYFAVNELSLTPDGKYVLALNGPLSSGKFLVFDTDKMEISQYYDLGLGRHFNNLTCQNKE